MNPLQMIIEGLTPNTGTEFTTTVVVSGIFIVLAMLVVLIFIFYGFGKIMSASTAKSKAKAQKKNEKANASQKTASAPAPKAAAPTAPAPTVQNGISDEVVAVITAAVVANEGTGAVIRSIKKSNVSGRNPWASAAVVNNTQPF